jgi:hypothetical protein
MSENETMTIEQQEAYNEFLKKIQEQIDPRDYLAPSMREIAKMPLDQLEAENLLIVAKQSTRSRAQRDLIQSRWEYEQTKANTADESN